MTKEVDKMLASIFWMLIEEFGELAEKECAEAIINAVRCLSYSNVGEINIKDFRHWGKIFNIKSELKTKYWMYNELNLTIQVNDYRISYHSSGIFRTRELQIVNYPTLLIEQ